MPRTGDRVYIPPATVEHFQSIDWTAKLLSNPEYEASTCDSRLPKPQYEDSFTAVTLASPNTIPHLLALKLKEMPIPPADLTPAISHLEHPTLIWLLTVVLEGMSGFPNIMHGGAIATMLDEGFSSLAALQRLAIRSDKNTPRADDVGLFPTAKLDITFKRPVILPGTYAVKTWVAALESKPRKRLKMFIHGAFVDEDNNVYAEARGLWIEVPLSRI